MCLKSSCINCRTPLKKIQCPPVEQGKKAECYVPESKAPLLLRLCPRCEAKKKPPSTSANVGGAGGDSIMTESGDPTVATTGTLLPAPVTQTELAESTLAGPGAKNKRTTSNKNDTSARRQNRQPVSTASSAHASSQPRSTSQTRSTTQQTPASQLQTASQQQHSADTVPDMPLPAPRAQGRMQLERLEDAHRARYGASQNLHGVDHPYNAALEARGWVEPEEWRVWRRNLPVEGGSSNDEARTRDPGWRLSRARSRFMQWPLPLPHEPYGAFRGRTMTIHPGIPEQVLRDQYEWRNEFDSVLRPTQATIDEDRAAAASAVPRASGDIDARGRRQRSDRAAGQEQSRSGNQGVPPSNDDRLTRPSDMLLLQPDGRGDMPLPPFGTKPFPPAPAVPRPGRSLNPPQEHPYKTELADRGINEPPLWMHWRASRGNSSSGTAAEHYEQILQDPDIRAWWLPWPFEDIEHYIQRQRSVNGREGKVEEDIMRLQHAWREHHDPYLSSKKRKQSEKYMARKSKAKASQDAAMRAFVDLRAPLGVSEAPLSSGIPRTTLTSMQSLSMDTPMTDAPVQVDRSQDEASGRPAPPHLAEGLGRQSQSGASSTAAAAQPDDMPLPPAGLIFDRIDNGTGPVDQHGNPIARAVKHPRAAILEGRGIHEPQLWEHWRGLTRGNSVTGTVSDAYAEAMRDFGGSGYPLPLPFEGEQEFERRQCFQNKRTDSATIKQQFAWRERNDFALSYQRRVKAMGALRAYGKLKALKDANPGATDGPGNRGGRKDDPDAGAGGAAAPFSSTSGVPTC